MLLCCKDAFGNFEPGDTVEVPDGAVFDRAHFEEVADAKAEPEAEPVAEEGN